MAKLLLKLESPLMVGGKRIYDNVLSTVDYISGSVMRSAFARRILLACPLYDPAIPDSMGRYNYVYIRDREKCAACPNHDMCSNFGKLKFSFFYLEGADIIPLTAVACKYHKDHGFKDTLAGAGEAVCSRCAEKYGRQSLENGRGGRMEPVSGYRRDNERFRPKRVQFTRTALDKYTQTARDGALYTVEALAAGLVFSGGIKGLDRQWLNEGDVIFVGKYTSSGFGRLRVMEIADDAKTGGLPAKLLHFNQRLKSANKRLDGGKTYIPLLFRSNAKLGIENLQLDKPMSGAEYRRIWERLLFGENGSPLEVVQVISEQEIYRGYDTSRAWGQWPKKPEIQLVKGSVVLLSTELSPEDIAPELERMVSEGIGTDTLNGYGDIEICNELHLKGEI